MPASPLKIINCHYWDGFSPEPGWEVKDDFCCFGRRRSSIRPVASVVDRLGRIKKGTKEQTLRHWSGAQIEKRQKHTHNALFLRWQTETERETEDLTLLDINWTPASFSPFKLLWPIRSHWWRLCSACVLLSSEAVSDPVRNDLHCWRLFRQSLKTIFFFFFFIDVDHYEANRKIYISFFFFFFFKLVIFIYVIAGQENAGNIFII